MQRLAIFFPVILYSMFNEKFYHMFFKRKISGFLVWCFLVVVTLLSSPVSAQWIESNSVVVTGGWGSLDLAFPAEDAAYITGDLGILYKSNNQGEDWDVQYNFGPFSSLNSPIFITADTGFVSANGGIQRTFDGGVSWASITDVWGQGVGIPLYKIKVTDRVLMGSYVQNDTMFIMKSNDFGDSFDTFFEYVATGVQPFMFSFLDTLTGFLINPLELEEMYKTSDGFLTLDTISISTGPIDLERCLHYSDEQNGYLFGDGGALSNPSRTWNDGGFFFPIDLDGFGVLPVLDMDFADTRIFASSLYGGIYYTINQGSSWVKQTTPIEGVVSSIDFLDENKGIAISGNTVLYTQNGGNIGLEEEGTGSSLIHVYPNPTFDEINLSMNINMEVDEIRILNLEGSLISKYEPSVKIISLVNYPNGVYILEIISKEKIIVKKIVKY